MITDYELRRNNSDGEEDKRKKLVICNLSKIYFSNYWKA